MGVYFIILNLMYSGAEDPLELRIYWIYRVSTTLIERLKFRNPFSKSEID